MILGICGLAGSGKDTVAKFLTLKYTFTVVALADPLKRICRDVYDFSEEQLWGPSAMRNAPDERYPRAHTYRSVTDPLCVCCGWDPSKQVRDTSEVPQCFLTPRYALQLLGTEWGRDCYPDTWATVCVRTAKTLISSEGGQFKYDQKKGLYSRIVPVEHGVAGVAITDVRFKNELRVIREGGGKAIRVRRPGAGLGGGAGTHPSEVEQASIPDSDFDAVLENDSTLDALQAKAIDLAANLGATQS